MDHHRWTASNNGPSSVGALAQTADGYLWLGTHDSLYRFDGFEFEKFVSIDGEPLGVVSALLSTSKGLWVGFRAGGARLISASGKLQPVVPGLPGGVIFSMAEDQQGQVWAAADDGLARYDGSKWHPVGKEAGFTERHARAVHVDADGYVWAASEEQLFTLPPEASAFIPVAIKSQSISEITSSAAGDIWITDRASDHVLRLKKTGYATIQIEEIPALRSVSMVLDEQGGAWLGTLGAGVHYLAVGQRPSSDDYTDRVSSYTVRDGLSSDKVLTQLIDRDGVLWVGTDAGLDRLKRMALTPLALPVGAGSHALAVSGDGSLWAGTDNGQLIGLRGDGDSTFKLDMPITALVNSQHHGLLVGGYRGIFSLSEDGLVRIASLPLVSPREAAVRAIAVGEDGAIWVSINRAGLYVWADKQWRRVEPVSDAERQVMPVAASRDLAGRPWFGYRDNLLVSVDNGKLTRWDEKQGLNIGHVTAMLHLPGRTWVGGQHGLAYLEDGRFYSLVLPAAGPFQNIYGLVAVPTEKNADGAGMDIWVHSRGGIFKLPADEIERVIAGGDALLYSSHDHIGRLPMDPYKVLPVPTAVYSEEEGLLWFATGNGVVPVDPYQPGGIAEPSAITIKSLTADGVDFDLSRPAVRLSAAPEKLVIAYSALNLAAPEDMRFQYRLNGHDSEWVDAERSRQAVFQRLRPGEYQFQVRALGEIENLSLPGATLTVSIPQVFYLRPGFLLISAATLILLAFWISRIYTRREKIAFRTRLEERFQERERIARELHDTLLQSVQGMMLSFQAVADTLPKDSRARHSMERALDRAEQVIAEGRDRITGLRGQMAPVEDLAAAFQTLQLEAGSSSAVYRVSNIGQPELLRSAVRDAFYQVGREAVLNALRHAQATQISVTFTYTPHRFEMLVVDDGDGIDPVYQRMRGRPEHGGLRGIYERAERIDATLSISSNVGKGTRISLSLPGSVAYEPTVGSALTHSSKAG